MADCVTYKIDSNRTGLSYAEEVCAKQLPNVSDDGHDPIWYEVEPNSYNDFGGDLTAKARNPLNASRQQAKGTTVDLDAVGGWNQDFTLHNTNRLLQGFFFADFREKASTKPYNGDQIVVSAAVASGNHFTLASGGQQFKNGMLILVSGPGVLNTDNMGLFKLTANGTATQLTVAETLVDETFSGEVIVTVVGYSFAADAVDLVAPGSVGTLTINDDPVAAAGVLTISSTNNAVDAETVTIGSQVYTFKTAAAAPYEVTVGVDKNASINNLVATVNGDNLLTPDAHPYFTAVNSTGGVMTITAKIKGAAFNGYATTETMTNGSWAHTATQDGTGISWLLFGAIPGEWGFLGGDETTEQFEDNIGYFRVGSVSDTELVMDKTTWDVSAKSGTGLTVNVFFGNVVKNESDVELIKTRYYQLERTLGQDTDGTQAEYVLASVSNELTFNIPTADFVDVDLGFIAADVAYRTGAEGLKDGTRVAAEGEEAYNTSSNVYRLRMSKVVPGDSYPDAFFGYITEGKLTIKNNVSAVKAVGALGGIDVTVGKFEAGGELTALFQTVGQNKSIRANDDVTLDLIFAKKNAGYLFDIPLLALGGGRLTISDADPVKVPLDAFGAKNAAGYTMLFNTFDYLPDAAMPAVAS